MSHIHSKDTNPEITARKELWRRGFRFRLHVHSLPGTPDIVLAKYRTAIFVNGCFWHGHNGCPKYTIPKSNTDFWKAKIAHNQERDLVNNQRLESLSWNILTVWECELSQKKIQATMERVDSELKANKEKWETYKTHRRQNRRFAIEQSIRHKAIVAEVEAELRAQFHIPARIRKESEDNSKL